MSIAAAVDPHVHPRGALSPSRAADFMSCPLKYRFRVVDRLPEKPSPAAVRGTVVHAVLERLFGLPRGQRRAVKRCAQCWGGQRRSGERRRPSDGATRQWRCSGR